MPGTRLVTVDDISIHTFLAEGDIITLDKPLGSWISIHTFLAEGDDTLLIGLRPREDFNPHLPRRR